MASKRLPNGRIPDTCPDCGHSVKFWRGDKGHMVTVACTELDKHGLQYTEPAASQPALHAREMVYDKDGVTLIEKPSTQSPEELAEIERLKTEVRGLLARKKELEAQEPAASPEADARLRTPEQAAAYWRSDEAMSND